MLDSETPMGLQPHSTGLHGCVKVLTPANMHQCSQAIERPHTITVIWWHRQSGTLNTSHHAFIAKRLEGGEPRGLQSWRCSAAKHQMQWHDVRAAGVHACAAPHLHSSSILLGWYLHVIHEVVVGPLVIWVLPTLLQLTSHMGLR